MKVVFRLNYYTRPGQSLWLKYSTVVESSGVRFDHEVPLKWVDSYHWELVMELNGVGKFRLDYFYQLRQENGVALDEWHAPRQVEVNFGSRDALVFLDTWRSAGAWDAAFETKPFFTNASSNDYRLSSNLNHSHLFFLHMASLPTGHIPCLFGAAKELGAWAPEAAIPMHQVARNTWQIGIDLDENQPLEYKYGLFDLSTKKAIRLELGENRILPARHFGEAQQTRVNDEVYRRDAAELFHGAGVAVPVFSLRSEKSMGVGEFLDLEPLADWAVSVGLKLIQILPINDTTSSHDWTDSYPYSAISVFALHPIYLRVDELEYKMPASFKLDLYAERERLNLSAQLDYVEVMRVKQRLCRQVYDRNRDWIMASAKFKSFLADNAHWLIPYAVFCVKRDEYKTADFTKWGDWQQYDPMAAKQLFDPHHPSWPLVAYHCWLQSELHLQLTRAVEHLHRNGLTLKGDLPIGIDRQSADAWSAPHLFKMDAQAGAPPDAFAVKGQNWGFPTYDWDAMSHDSFAWWRSRFKQLSRYFDAYRIDHILGFFRIWQVPTKHTEGIMGYFDPAIPIELTEFHQRGISFDFQRFCEPYLTRNFLDEKFAGCDESFLQTYFDPSENGNYRLREFVLTQKAVMALSDDSIKPSLLDCVSEVLFFEVPGSNGTKFHPRCSLEMTHSFRALPWDQQTKIIDLYNDYFYVRQNDFWEARGLETLPLMRSASSMLLCGEDLGMVPACVPGVLRELGILSLEIQRMPKVSGIDFSDPSRAPYLSVVSPSTHDMSTLRAWWLEDAAVSRRFAAEMLGLDINPTELTVDLVKKIIRQHLDSPAMWAIFPLQDLWSIDENLRPLSPDSERINVPAIMPYYWRYRMHVTLEQVAAQSSFNQELKNLIESSGR